MAWGVELEGMIPGSLDLAACAVLQERADATPCGAADSGAQAAPMDDPGDNQPGGACLCNAVTDAR
jgi:hypothetical protein